MKSARHTIILQLIDQGNIETQEDLVEQLQARGFEVTQATVSRDIREMHLVKVQTGDGRYKYATVDQSESSMMERFINMFAQSVLSIATAGNIIVIKVLSGSANVAAEAIDSMRWSEIVGTLAGDNTVFCAVADGVNVAEVAERFQSLSQSN